jgi:VCBS repeat-containing protein
LEAILTATASVAPTGNAYIDGVLSGIKWGVSNLTYSFPTSASYYEYSGERDTNFQVFNAAQQDAVRKVFANYSAVANITFTEITETSTQHATLRFAESDSPSTAWAYYPSTAAQGGDAWFNSSKQYYDNPVKGNYAYLTGLHEIGHSLGLKHLHEAKGSFGAMPADQDSLEYSVMSYRSYVGGPTTGYTLGSTSYPQTLMMLDIAALQVMYGANYSTNSGNSVYSWSATTGEMFINGVGQGAPAGNKIFMTVWDGGGNDTYDFSNYTTNLTINLSPGGWSTTSATQLASLGSGKVAAGNIANALQFQGNAASLIENAIGGSGNDTIIGNSADNRLTGGRGSDVLDGGAGSDSAVYSGLLANYSWRENADGSWTVTDLRTGTPDGIDTLWNIEFLQFADAVNAIGGDTPPPPPTPTNALPAFTSLAPTVTLTEWADKSADETANTPHVASGKMTFSDADGGDMHGATFVQQGTGYIGTFSLGAVDQATDQFNWSFSVTDSAMDYLKAGQSLTQKYNVSLSDGQGGTSVQTVTIVLSGTDDATTTTTKKAPPGKGKSGGSDQGTDGGVDVLSWQDMLEDQVPTPFAVYVGVNNGPAHATAGIVIASAHVPDAVTDLGWFLGAEGGL